MTTPKAPGPTQAERFFFNVLWNWMAVIANIFTGIFLTPYIIRKIGDQRYGIWALVFALIEYVFLFDLGFRAAIVNFVSRFRVQDDSAGINEVINTALAYFLGVASLVVALTLTLAGEGYRFFPKISPENRADFTFLLTLIGFTWAAGIISNIFQASLEAFQQFKTYNHIFIVMLILRSGGCALALFLGFGVRAMGLSVVAAQCTGYILMFLTFRRAFAGLRFSRVFVRPERWKQMARYGANSLVASTGTLFLNQGPPLLIGHFLPPAFVGYFTVPSRLLNYLVEMITRIGYVTAPKAAELYALGQTDQIVRLGTHLNRYCLALFMPISIFMGVFGTQLVARWIGPVFAEHSGPLIPIFATSVLLAVSAQFNSSGILFGIAKHGAYARWIVAEALISFAGIAFVLPFYGIFGAACVSASLAILSRGLITPGILCRSLHYSYWLYMREIYFRPLLSAIPVLALALYLRHTWLPGRTWFELAAAVAMVSGSGLLICLFSCVEPEHRLMLAESALRALRFGKKQQVTA